MCIRDSSISFFTSKHTHSYPLTYFNPFTLALRQLHDAARNVAFIAGIAATIAGSWIFTGKWWKAGDGGRFFIEMGGGSRTAIDSIQHEVGWTWIDTVCGLELLNPSHFILLFDECKKTAQESELGMTTLITIAQTHTQVDQIAFLWKTFQ